MKNHALVFIKPHADREKAVAFIENFLSQKGLKVESSGTLTADQIEEQEIIENHYSSIAYSAVRKTPSELAMPEDIKAAFEKHFNSSWDELIKQNRLVNCVEARKRLNNISGRELNDIWKESKQLKLAPGTYAAHFSESGLFVINGFYQAMKEMYTLPGSLIRWYVFSFDAHSLSWEEFRESVIGATNPAAALEGSLRQLILKNWQELDLPYEPNMTENGVHASAGPVEALKERIIWAGTSISTDPLGKVLLEEGLSEEAIQKILENPEIMLKDQEGPLFDLTEDMDTDEILPLLNGFS